MMFAYRMFGWLLGGIYGTIPLFWLMVHPFATFWRTRFRAPLKILGALWIVLWFVAWIVTAPWRMQLLYDHAWPVLLAIPLWLTSATIYLVGGWQFSLEQIIGRYEVELDRNQNLVTDGLHGYVRHPLYVGHFCTLLGLAISTGTVAVWGLLAFALFAGAIMIRFEDAELEQRFGAPYREYRQRVPAVIPKL
jgi:protein-S-isoprenylcysteine O-methyltransferase Ste14